jgi:hypothetical protein
MLVTKSFWEETTTGQGIGANAELERFAADGFAAASTSLDLMGREALEMSVSPATQKRSKPSAGADESTVMLPVVTFLLEEFRHALGDREHGRGTSGDDVASHFIGFGEVRAAR